MLPTPSKNRKIENKKHRENEENQQKTENERTPLVLKRLAQPEVERYEENTKHKLNY